MSESATLSGPTLEQILWRSLDRWTEDPALVDRGEFSAHIAQAFGGDVPAEAFVDRFFEGDPLERMQRPADMAEAIVRATRERLHVFEFDLDRLDYVVLEEKDKLVVVSDFGQFGLDNNDIVSRAIEAAVIPGGRSSQQASAEPKAYLVRQTGEVVAVDASKMARALEQLKVRQVSAPAVEKPLSRLAPFAPVKRRLSESREAQVLRQDPRASLPLPPPTQRLNETRAELAAAPDGKSGSALPPPAAPAAIFLLLPDGSLARPAMGAATRWKEMVADWSSRAEAISSPAARTMAVAATQRFALQAGKVVALIKQTDRTSPGAAGDMTQTRGAGLAAARGGLAPVRVLGDDELARAVTRGATLVPGWATKLDDDGRKGERFWIQPEASFAPAAHDREVVGVSRKSEAAQPQPLQLGEITGDPWSDWALTGGGQIEPQMLMAARGRTRHALRAGLGRDTEALDLPAAPELREARAREVRLSGAPVVAFRMPDGTVVAQRRDGVIRLATAIRPVDLPPLEAVAFGMAAAGARREDIAPRAGAVPATALASLQLAVEQTARASGYKLPILTVQSAPDAIEVGSSFALELDDSRRTSARLAGPITFAPGLGGQAAQLVLSMPFPNSGEVHVGEDLSAALTSYLGAPAVPSWATYAGNAGSSATAAPALGAFALALGDGPVIGGGASSAQSGQGATFTSAAGDLFDLDDLHLAASGRARESMLTLQLPSVAPLLSREPDVSGLPSLLASALKSSGDWSPGPGAPLPGGIRDFVLRGPFDLPELMQGPGELSFTPGAFPAAEPRGLSAGEDEIVIPMPLWAQMGRGRLSGTDVILASPLAGRGYAPPLGAYRLVAPAPLGDLSQGAPAGTDGVLELSGPTSLALVSEPARRGAVSAQDRGGEFKLARVPVDDGATTVSRRGRMRIGAPIDAAAILAARAARGEGQQGSPQPGLSREMPSEAPQRQSWNNVLSAQSEAAPGADSIVSKSSLAGEAPRTTFVSGERPFASVAQVPNDSFVDGTRTFSERAAPRPMAGALRSALRMSDDVGARAAPGRPSLPGLDGSTSFGPASSGVPFAGTTYGSASGMGTSQRSLVSGGPDAAPAAARLVSPGSNAAPGAPAILSVSDPAQAGSLVAGQQAERGDPSVAGLPRGAWSGNTRSQGNYAPWVYSDSLPNAQSDAGGVGLSGLSRPVYPSLPTALRFRYVGAPLWWSATSRSLAAPADDLAGGALEATSPSRALGAGLRASNSAAAIWRSIFVMSGSPEGLDAPGDGDAGGMDNRWDGAADRLGAVGSRMDALATGALVASSAGGAAAKGSETVYIAMDQAGRAGPTSAKDLLQGRASAVEMSIVAAIPPAPPSLESMGTGGGADAPHARQKKAGNQEHKEASDAVSNSKIEGSVDAVAQRIYHRIRRRIESDRERFGG